MSIPSGPGWYDDPDNTEQLRYFDGVVWTPHTTPRRTRSVTSDAGQGGATTATPVSGASANDGQAPVPPAPAPMPQAPHPYAAQSVGGTGPTTTDGTPLATYPIRALAYIIDWVITQVLALLIGFYPLYRALEPVMGPLNAATRAGDAEAAVLAYSKLSPGWFAAFIGISLAVRLAYDLLFLLKKGAQPGKLVTGIHVRAVEHDGPLTFDQVSRRTGFMVGLSAVSALPVLGTAATIIKIVDLLFPLRDAQRQALHDKVARTVVVKGPRPKQ